MRPCHPNCSHGTVKQGVTSVYNRQIYDWTSVRDPVLRWQIATHHFGWKRHLTSCFHRAPAALYERRSKVHSLEECQLWEARDAAGKIRQPHSVISQDSAEIRGNKEQRYCYVTNRFPNLNSRSAVCCHKSAALFTQTYRFSQVVTGKAFLGWESYGISWWTACKRKRVM